VTAEGSGMITPWKRGYLMDATKIGPVIREA
jgi:hypothetical protein